MNWKLFLSTFVMIFLAELGDKTQLSVVSRAASASARWTVFVAASLALVVSTLVAVLWGGLLSRYVPERYIKIGAGALFLLIGALVLREGWLPERPVAARAAPAPVGALGRLVLAQAAAFEQSAFEDYRALAAKAATPALRDLLGQLAAEEEDHFQHLGALQRAHGEEVGVPEAAAAEWPPVEALTHDVAASDREVLAHALEHEEATACFYRQLARQTPLPSLRQAFTNLVAAEESHAARLREVVVGP